MYHLPSDFIHFAKLGRAGNSDLTSHMLHRKILCLASVWPGLAASAFVCQGADQNQGHQAVSPHGCQFKILFGLQVTVLNLLCIKLILFFLSCVVQCCFPYTEVSSLTVSKLGIRPPSLLVPWCHPGGLSSALPCSVTVGFICGLYPTLLFIYSPSHTQTLSQAWGPKPQFLGF